MASTACRVRVRGLRKCVHLLLPIAKLLSVRVGLLVTFFYFTLRAYSYEWRDFALSFSTT